MTALHPTSPGSRGRRAAVTGSWLTVAVLFIGVNLDTDLGWRYLLDMDVYRQGAAHFWSGPRPTDLYDISFPTRSDSLPFTYPPFAALVFTPLWLLSELIGQVATERVHTLVSVLALWLIARALLRVHGSRVPAVVLLAVMMAGSPTLSTLDLGQINTVLMAMVLLDVTRALPRLPLGLLTGIAAAIKLTPLVFALFFLILWFTRRRPGGLLWMSLGFSGATLAAWVVQPGTSLTYWTRTLQSTGRIGDPAYAKNVSVQGLLARFPQLGEARLLWLAAVVLIIAGTAVACVRILRTSASLPAQTLATVLVALIALLCSPVSWSHHWVWLGPLAVCLWFSGHRFFAGWAFFAQTFGAFHMFITGGGGRELSWSPLQHLLGTHYLWFSAILLLWFALAPQAAKPDTGPAAGPGRQPQGSGAGHPMR